MIALVGRTKEEMDYARMLGATIKERREKLHARQVDLAAAMFAAAGYVPVSQSWAPGSWGCGAFLVALLLAFVLVGILVFIYMLLVKPAGTLTVTYQRQPA